MTTIEQYLKALGRPTVTAVTKAVVRNNRYQAAVRLQGITTLRSSILRILTVKLINHMPAASSMTAAAVEFEVISKRAVALQEAMILASLARAAAETPTSDRAMDVVVANAMADATIVASENSLNTLIASAEAAEQAATVKKDEALSAMTPAAAKKFIQFCSQLDGKASKAQSRILSGLASEPDEKKFNWVLAVLTGAVDHVKTAIITGLGITLVFLLTGHTFE